MTLVEELAASNALMVAAAKVGIPFNVAQRLVQEIVALPDTGLAILASVKHEQVVAEQRRAQRAEVRELSAARRKAMR